MKIDWKRFLRLGKDIMVFFLGVIFVHFFTQVIMSTSFPEIIEEISREGTEDFIGNLDKEVFSILIKIYIISFILFNQLPEKIKKAKWYLRGIYFIIFYLLCILVYLWI